MHDPAIRGEVGRLEREEMPMFDTILAARQAAGLTQAQVAERMGTKAPAVTRLKTHLLPDRLHLQSRHYENMRRRWVNAWR